VTHSALVVGLGKIGFGYDAAEEPGSPSVRTHAKAFDLSDAFELCGGVDPDSSARRAFEERFGKPAFQDLVAALSQTKPDVVAMAVPTQFHLETTRCVLEHAAPKLILCEKPIANSLTEAEEIISLCKGAGVKLFVNYIRRADPVSQAVQAAILQGLIASPIGGEAHYSAGLRHNGSHLLDLLYFWLGEPLLSKIRVRGDDLDFGDCNPEVEIKFQNGGIVFKPSTVENASGTRIDLVSETGNLAYRNGGNDVSWHPDETKAGGQIQLFENRRLGPGLSGYQAMVALQLDDALAGRETTLCTGEEALRHLKFINSICEQNRQ
jgi:predicted dehydrogenase